MTKYLIIFIAVTGMLLLFSCYKNECDAPPEPTYEQVLDCPGEYRIHHFKNDTATEIYSYNAQGLIYKHAMAGSRAGNVYVYNTENQIIKALRVVFCDQTVLAWMMDSLVYNTAGHLRQRIRMKLDGSEKEVFFINTDDRGRIVSDSIAPLPGYSSVIYYKWSDDNNITQVLLKNGDALLSEATYTYDDKPNPLHELRHAYIAMGIYDIHYLSSNNCTSVRIEGPHIPKYQKDYIFAYHANGLPKSRMPGDFKYVYECP